MNQLTSDIAVYTGSFDPPTLGHMSVIERSSRLFKKLVIGVGINVEKASLFSPEERVELLTKATAHCGNVEVRSFTGLAVEFVRECGSRVMVRGVRPLADIEAELTMMMANRRLAPDIETLFMIADGELAHVSSSLIKQITPLSSDERLARFVPRVIIPALRAKIPQQR